MDACCDWLNIRSPRHRLRSQRVSRHQLLFVSIQSILTTHSLLPCCLFFRVASSSSLLNADDDDDDERKRMVEQETFEERTITTLDALASAAVAFVEKTHNHKFFHRVARADAATERIFDYFFEESKHSFDELSGVSISADQ